MAKSKEVFEQFYQGDVSIMKLPASFDVGTLEAEIPAEFGKVRLLEGELTGHHHEIDLLDRPAAKAPSKGASKGDARFLDESLNEMFLDKEVAAPTVKFFKATNLANDLVKKGILVRSDLIIGLLKIDGGPMRVQHPEHQSIMLAPGNYVVGRQVESVAGEERAVAD